MKRFITALVTGAIVAPLAFASLATAQSSTTPTETKPQTTTTQTEKPLTAEQLKLLQERVAKRKADLKLKVTAVEQKRLQTKCKQAQVPLKALGTRGATGEIKRTEAHSKIVDRLTNLEAKLAAKGLDSTALKANIAELQIKINTFNTDLAAYKQVLSDVSQMDCAADPVAFKASLETVRTAQKKVHADAVAIRAYIKDTIKPTLAALRLQLGEAKPEAN